jgi:lipopolysaccharide/colanic/teichoic acid biosynthesis glycosyltransferase
LVIGQSLFREVVARERKRADRFSEAFALVVVSCDRQGLHDSEAWRLIVEALSATKRDTDVLGWLDHGSALGLIAPEIGPSDGSFARELESRIQQSLTAAVDAEVRAGFSIRLYRHAGLGGTSAAVTERATPIPSELHSATGTTVRSALKRGLDIVASGALLLLLSPILALIAVLIKVKSPGPVFFRQVRVGESGKSFTMLRFRTMRVGNDATIHQAFVSQFIKAGTPSGGDSAADAPFKIVNDPRVTSIGKLLRSTSLDELPQLWNVLRGDMSLVGPRPPLHYEVEQYKPWHYRRVLEAKPGITGLWQVSGRSRTTFDDMVRLDLRYAKKSSAWTDIKILLATPRAVISGKGAC